MSNTDIPSDTPKPANLAGRGIQPRFGELVQECRKLVMNRLAEQLAELFAQVDDTLFECADKAENNRVQTLFFDNMRDLRKLRPQIERSYHQRIATNFAEFLEGKGAAQNAPVELDADELSLVQNEDYEESLQVTNMVSRVKARAAQSLFALEQRLALLNNGQKLGEDSNPFGPQAIAQAFRQALAPHPFPLRIKMTLYVLFDQHVMYSLDKLYQALNSRLIERGILPNLKLNALRKPDSSRPATAPPTPTTAEHAGPEDRPSVDANQLLDSLTILLNEHRQRQAGSALLGGTPSITHYVPHAESTYSRSELFEALDHLQRQSAREFSRLVQQPKAVGAFKADLQQQLSVESSNKPKALANVEADVIDLVGMLFDFILDDDNLPDSFKAALSHLHTPYLRIALQDRALFTQHQHPARRLLNAMAKAGVLYGDEENERGLLAKIHWVIEQIINSFDGDMRQLEQLLGEFNEYLVTLRHKVELRERRAIEAAKGRDKLLDARQRAVDVINHALHERSVPAIIHNFLELTWTDVLVFILLRSGVDSVEWHRAGEVAERLAWSGTVLDEEGKARLQQIRLPLLDDMRQGLELLGGYHADGVRRLLQDIVACQHAVQAQQPQIAERLKANLPESPLGAMLGEDAGPIISQTLTPLSPRQQELVRELQRLEFGTWFEFVLGQERRQLKLSWFSSTTHNYMFVDQTGQRAAIKPIRQLALEIESGQARILTAERESPLMDRALGAIVRVLQRLTGRPPENSQGA
ncbi:DUF1631 domain-containing protein [Pseudomonas sp. LRF_L74]|uniref:DUF1631 domain-containing protein n=1 Tax=Pseudomonas sp. LRF_L74 TaxID=3369422 RepID=UPI003F5E441E